MSDRAGHNEPGSGAGADDAVDPGAAVAAGLTALRHLAETRRLAALVGDALTEVASPRDAAVWLAMAEERAIGNRHPAVTVAARFEMRPDAIRQVAHRVGRRLDAATAEPRFAALRTLPLLAQRAPHERPRGHPERSARTALCTGSVAHQPIRCTESGSRGSRRQCEVVDEGGDDVARTFDDVFVHERDNSPTVQGQTGAAFRVALAVPPGGVGAVTGDLGHETGIVPEQVDPGGAATVAATAAPPALRRSFT